MSLPFGFETQRTFSLASQRFSLPPLKLSPVPSKASDILGFGAKTPRRQYLERLSNSRKERYLRWAMKRPVEARAVQRRRFARFLSARELRLFLGRRKQLTRFRFFQLRHFAESQRLKIKDSSKPASRLLKEASSLLPLVYFKSYASPSPFTPLSPFRFLRQIGKKKLWLLRRKKTSFRLKWKKLKTYRFVQLRRLLLSFPLQRDSANFRRIFFSFLLKRYLPGFKTKAWKDSRPGFKIKTFNFPRFLKSLKRRRSRPLSLRVFHRRWLQRALFSFCRRHPLTLTKNPRGLQRALFSFLYRRYLRTPSSKLRRLKLKVLFSSLRRPFPLSLVRLYWKLKLRLKLFRLSLPLAKLHRFQLRLKARLKLKKSPSTNNSLVKRKEQRRLSKRILWYLCKRFASSSLRSQRTLKEILQRRQVLKAKLSWRHFRESVSRYRQQRRHGPFRKKPSPSVPRKRRRYLLIRYGTLPKFLHKKGRFRGPRSSRWVQRRPRSLEQQRRPRSLEQQRRPRSLEQQRRPRSLEQQRFYHYLFVLPILPLWLLYFFSFFFIQQKNVLASLWLNLFILFSSKRAFLILPTLLSFHNYTFFQRQSALNFNNCNNFLYAVCFYDSIRFLFHNALSLNDFDRRKLPRRSLWLLKKKPWKRFPQKRFEGYKRGSGDAFFEKHLFLSFDYSYSIRFSFSPLTIFSTIKIYRSI